MATFEFKLPDLGEGVAEGEIVKWLVKPGDTVQEDQSVVELMTDKATVSVPAPRAGKVVSLHGKEGDIAKVHHPLLTLEVAGGAPAAAAASAPASSAPAASGPAPAAARAVEAAKVLATPVTRRMAREHGLDLAAISGTGPQGRVLKADVQAALDLGRVPEPVQAPPRAKLVPLPSAGADQRIPIRGLRRKIAEKMVRSKFTAPHSLFVEEVDVSELVALRKRLNASLAEAGDSLKVSFLPFVCKALVSVFRKYPSLNANFDDAAQELVQRGSFNFGIAAATDEGLTVPVLKDVDRLTVRQLAEEISRLAAGARDRTLKLDELTGGTFTITSLGTNGGLFAMPIINYPEVAILGVHRIRKRPVVTEDEQIVVREMMNVSLSFDHRVIDGLVAAEAVGALVQLLEHPESLLLEMA
ncbi:MAG TPA: dihydrolipoamide acetyltransferase family protein [Myxococcaceae bacterium]|nr:dihydrolipoamide acetyltransferase family protein [Myxococcaceae bacterium]